eukprot:4783187-Prymnesium_polylepis.1
MLHGLASNQHCNNQVLPQLRRRQHTQRKVKEFIYVHLLSRPRKQHGLKEELSTLLRARDGLWRCVTSAAA